MKKTLCIAGVGLQAASLVLGTNGAPTFLQALGVGSGILALIIGVMSED